MLRVGECERENQGIVDAVAGCVGVSWAPALIQHSRIPCQHRREGLKPIPTPSLGYPVLPRCEARRWVAGGAEKTNMFGPLRPHTVIAIPPQRAPRKVYKLAHVYYMTLELLFTL